MNPIKTTIMSRITDVKLYTAAPGGLVSSPPTVLSSGSTTCKPVFVGLLAPSTATGNQVVVVFKVTNCMLTKGNVLIGSSGVEMTIGNSHNDFFYVALDQTDIQNWTVQVRTKRDPPSNTNVYTAGTGGGA